MQFVFIAALFVQENHAVAQIPCRYDVTVIQAPPCAFTGPPPTIALGISPNGRYVVGRYQPCDPESDEAWVYDTKTEQFLTLSRPEGTFGAVASDVNDSGWIVGYYGKNGVGNRGFVYKLHANEWIELPPVGTGQSIAAGINNNGQVCGTRRIGKSANSNSAFIWSEKDGFTDLGLINKQRTTASDINENGAVTGTMVVNETSTAFIWDENGITTLGSLADMQTAPFGLNNHGDVAGYSFIPLKSFPHIGSRAFGWLDDSIKDLGTLTKHDHNLSTGQDLNDLREIIGTSSKSATDTRSFIWRLGVMRELNEFIDPGIQIFVSSGGEILNSGVIVGSGNNNESDVVALILRPAVVVKGDVDANCVVNVNDLRAVILEWGQKESIADINSDGIVNRKDLVIVLDNWGNTN